MSSVFVTNNVYIIVDNSLMLNCLVLCGLIVSEGLRKSSPNVTIFFAKFQSQFDSLYTPCPEKKVPLYFCL